MSQEWGWVPTLALCVILFSLNAGLRAEANTRVPEGKSLTDRSLVFRAVVEASPEEVYRYWTTPEGVRRFFGEDAEIDLKAGGCYHVYFLPKTHAEAGPNSSEGARILWLEPGRRIAFEWTSPPFARELSTQPLPLWVEVSLLPLPPSRTVVEIAGYGFGRGSAWDRVFEFFVRGWSEILYRLDRVLVDPDFHPGWPANPR